MLTIAKVELKFYW